MKMRLHYFTIFLFFNLMILKIHGNEQNILNNLSAFFPMDSKFKKIYGVSPMHHVEYDMIIKNNLFNSKTNLNAFVSFSYLYGSGKTNLNSHSHIHYLPLSLGVDLRFQYKNNNLIPYLGVGPVVAYSNIHNHSGKSCYLDKNQNSWGIGLRTKSGIFARITPSLLFNFFCRLLFNKNVFSL